MALRDRHRLLCANIFAAGGLVASPCAAQVPCLQQVEADRLEDEGNLLRTRHDDTAAVERFSRAHALCRSPRVVARLGGAEGALRRYVEAERHLQEALDTGADNVWVAGHRAVLEAALQAARAHLATVELAGDGPTAEVTLHGELRGRWPAERRFRVIAGAVAMIVRAPGCQDLTRTLNVAAGASVSEVISLACDAPPPPPPPVVLPSTRRTLAWVSVGATAAAFGAGAVAFGVYLYQVGEWNDNARCFTETYESRWQNCAATWSALHTSGLIMGVGFGLAAAFGVTSAVLFATTPPRTRAALEWRCRGGPGELGVTCGATF